MRKACVLVAAMMCACGSVSPREEPIDAPSMPRCNPDSPFRAPVPISEINTAASEEFAYLSPDELTMYFSSDRPGTLGRYDIFMVTRPKRDAPWENIVPVPGVNTPNGHERRPMVTGDGATMYALIGGSPDEDIGIATRIGMTATFTSFTTAAISVVSFNDEPGTILPDHRAIWFSSDRAGNGNYEIFRARRSSAGFDTSVLASGVNDPGAADKYPVVTPDELKLFFSRNRRGGAEGYEILGATRASAADPFDAVQIVQAVNMDDALNNIPTWVSADGCALYIMAGDPSAYDLFVATRGM